jgi:hypothetical protein
MNLCQISHVLMGLYPVNQACVGWPITNLNCSDSPIYTLLVRTFTCEALAVNLQEEYTLPGFFQLAFYNFGGQTHFLNRSIGGNMKKLIGGLLLAALALFGIIQLVPYGREHANPAVVQEPQWSSPQVRAIAQRACFDCHSNVTIWPWYSNVAPFSWLIQHDVDEGRRRLNFSEWGRGRQRSDEVGEVIQRGSMPPAYYVMLHPTAKLSSSEKDTLIRGSPGGEAETSGRDVGD